MAFIDFQVDLGNSAIVIQYYAKMYCIFFTFKMKCYACTYERAYV